MVVAANPIAAKIGADILARGGSAADAAIATQLALGLVEPQSSGLGGGGFLLHWQATDRTMTSLDARETAPMAATPELFMGSNGQPVGFYDAVVGGRSVGVPGVPALLWTIHRRWGKTPWTDLFAPTIALAEEGFAISPRLAGLIAGDRYLARDPVARAYFFSPDGTPKRAGTILKNPAYAAVLRQIAAEGPAAFYTGPIAKAMVTAAAAEPNPGAMTMADLAAYKVVDRPPVCGPYRGYRLCAMGPPSSGGVTVLQMLALLEPFDLKTLGAQNPLGLHLMMQASALAYADRDSYLADPDFAPSPVRGLLDPGYLAERGRAIAPDARFLPAKPGTPPERAGMSPPPAGFSPELPATSHMSILDRDGNAVSFTTTIEDGFGARRMVAGFLLNNQLTDFSFRPEADGKPVANRVQPGKRPRSSMTPLFAFDPDGKLAFVAGSPGGSRIIGYVARSIIGMIDFDLDAQSAVDLQHVTNRNGGTDIEVGPHAEVWREALEALGHRVTISDLNSGLHIIRIRPDGLEGGADPRREGLAVGR
jgi:gamma-glutamyltranspeptidase/glutathione hydrolase